MTANIANRNIQQADLRHWLRQGWNDFMEASWASSAYAAVFCVLGIVAAVWLTAEGWGLLFFVLAGGFVMLAPILATGYYRLSDLLREGKEPRFDDAVSAYRHNSGTVWGIAFIVGIIFLIWISDAVLAYGLYFEDSRLAFGEILGDEEMTANAGTYLVISALLGSFLAMSIYALTVFSIPYAFDQQVGLVEAMQASVQLVFGNLAVMLQWAALLAVLMFATLLFALPLLIVVFPTLAFASYAAYRDVFGVEAGATAS